MKLTVDKSAENDVKEFFKEELQKQAKEIFEEIEKKRTPYSPNVLLIKREDYLELKAKYLKRVKY